MPLGNTSPYKITMHVHASSRIYGMHVSRSYSTRKNTQPASSQQPKLLQFTVCWSPGSAFRSLKWQHGNRTRHLGGHFCHFVQKDPPDVKIEFDEDGDLLADADKDIDFNDVVLDDELYKSMGMTKEQAAEDQASLGVDYADPEGFDLTLENMAKLRPDVNMDILKALQNQKLFGPPVALIAGFRVEELAIVRVLLDSAGGHAIKVVPVKTDMMSMRVEDAVHLPEPDWEKPRPENFTLGGGWGAQRVIIFGGVRVEAQAAVVELLEETGLPPVCIGVAAEETQSMLLGELLAEAVRMQRGRKNPDKQIWDMEGHVSNRLPNLQDFLQNEIKDRISSISESLESGEVDLEGGEESPLQVTLDDVIPRNVPRDQINLEDMINKGNMADEGVPTDGSEQECDNSKGGNELVVGANPETDAEDEAMLRVRGQGGDADECKEKLSSDGSDVRNAANSKSWDRSVESWADDESQAARMPPGGLVVEQGTAVSSSKQTSSHMSRMETEELTREVGVWRMSGAAKSKRQVSEVGPCTNGAKIEDSLVGDGEHAPKQHGPTPTGVRNEFTLIDDLVEGLVSPKDSGVGVTSSSASGEQHHSQDFMDPSAGQRVSQMPPRKSADNGSDHLSCENATNVLQDKDATSFRGQTAIDVGVEDAAAIRLGSNAADARKESKSDAPSAPAPAGAAVQEAGSLAQAMVMDEQPGMFERKSLRRDGYVTEDLGMPAAGVAAAIDPQAAIQSVLATGADPEELKRMIDEMARNSSGTKTTQPTGAKGLRSTRAAARSGATQRRKPVRRFVSRKDVSSSRKSQIQYGWNRYRGSSRTVVPMDTSKDGDLAEMAAAVFGSGVNSEGNFSNAEIDGQNGEAGHGGPEYEEWLKKVAQWEAQGVPLDVDAVGEVIMEDVKSSSPDSPESVSRVRNMTVQELREYADKKGMTFTTMLKDAESSGIELDAE